KYRYARAMTIEQSINQVQVPWSTAARAHSQAPSEVRFGTGCECRHLLVPHVNPLDLALSPQCIGDSVEAVADDPVNPPHAHERENLDELISYGPGHRHVP